MKVELLAPAGDEQSAQLALDAGADAVYLGLTRFSARATAENFDFAALSRVTRYAHLLGAKVYVALNTLVKDGETEEFFESARKSWDAGADAILVQDIFLGRQIKETWGEIILHLSTQGGCCNVYGAEVAKEYGFSRVVLARETPIEEIRKISKIIETEVFAQGALCTSFSGQCYLSSFAGGNSGNRGRCKQPCRKKYSIDRAGFETPAYALSTSDLCVGDRAKEFLDAGVVSLKIEGRLRRPEYVAASVAYYRAVLEGGDTKETLSHLRRAYNRGDYTAGLAFGQDDRFLSRKVQGHIGEKVGMISLRKGKYFCKSDYSAGKGDGFKILRDSYEVGGATFSEKTDVGFCLTSKTRLLAGDEVRLTTEKNPPIPTFSRKKVEISLQFLAGERPKARCGDYEFVGENPLERAKNAPLKEEELIACFEKTDALPFEAKITVETDGIFLPKSALNAFRRRFYEGLASCLAPERAPLPERKIHAEILPKEGHLTASINGEGDLVIRKPSDYRNLQLKAGEWLYLPPFLTSDEADDIMHRADTCAGIYCDGYYGIALARKYGKLLFSGVGFNLTNSIAVNGVQKCAKYFTLSKELNSREQAPLAAEGAFVLARGGIKVMDLIYCPFSKNCATCDQRRRYTLTDEDGRTFPLLRYRVNGNCRFELYNCACLEAGAPCSVLVDGTVTGGATTRGHSERGIL